MSKAFGYVPDFKPKEDKTETELCFYELYYMGGEERIINFIQRIYVEAYTTKMI